MVSSSKWHLGKKIVNILSLVSSSKLHLGLANTQTVLLYQVANCQITKTRTFEELENKCRIFPSYPVLQMSLQEALRAKALKEQEKERKEFYDKQKMGMKDNRAKYREKVADNH